MDSIPPGPPAVLGIDLGTSQVKALLAAADGTVLGQGAAGYQVSTPRDGWAETDLDQWWRATAAAVRSATGASDTAASLHAVSLAPGWGLLTLGSGGQWIIPGAGTSTRPAAGTNLLRSADGGTFRLAGAQNVGLTLDWVRRTLGASWDGLYATAARPWRSGTPVFLPYMVGERWAHRDSGGAWTGPGPPAGRPAARGPAGSGLPAPRPARRPAGSRQRPGPGLAGRRWQPVGGLASAAR